MSGILQPSGIGLGNTLGAATPPEPEVQLRWPGLDPVDPSLDVMIFDDSYSLQGSDGNDPVGNRYTEARRAVRLLASWTRTDRQQVAVVHFDYPHAEVVGPYRLDKSKSRDQVLAALGEPQGAAGSSVLAPAMGAATALAREHGGRVRCTIFSDFELADLNQAQPYEAMAAFPGLVHAVVLNADPPGSLAVLDNVTITRVASDSPPGLFAAALMHSLATGRRGARRPVLRRSRAREPA